MRIQKKAVALVLVFIFTIAGMLPVAADSPYLGYTFNFWRDMVPAPVAYVATRSITAADIYVCANTFPDVTLGSFSRASDIFVDSNYIIYVVDTGNNRIVAFDQNLNLLRIINSFEVGGEAHTFNSPGGIFVCDNLNIHIADTENNRIVTLDYDGNFIRMIYDLDMGDIEDEVIFRPDRIAVDRAGRTYAVVTGVFEGIMRFDEHGNFFGYMGTITVRASAADLFWRRLATEAQRENQRRFIPTEFSGICIDNYGFVFATHADVHGGGDQVMRLNPRGNNVIRNFNENTNLSGDQRAHFHGRGAGPSVFIDVVTRPNGMYSVLDRTMNRVFTYDSEGNLLYVFGGDGEVMGTMRLPVALCALGDSILVLDGARGRIVQYSPTIYGMLINEAVGLRYHGNEAGSVEVWQQIMLINEFNTLALTGIGRAHLLEGNYNMAMDYLRRGMDLRYYSFALVRRRQVFVDTYLSYFLTGLLVVAVALAGRSVYKNVKGLNARGEEAYD